MENNMETYIFKKSKLLSGIAEHTLNSVEFSNPYGAYNDMVSTPHLDLVKDQGLYLMSGSSTNFKTDLNTEGSSVVYAVDCNPDLDDDWFSECYPLGGDDFVEPIELSNSVLERLASGSYHLVIRISDTLIETGITQKL